MAAVALGACSPTPWTMASYPRSTRSQRRSRSIAQYRPPTEAMRASGWTGAEPRLEVRDEVETRGRWRVATVEEGMDPDARHAALGRQRDERDEVAVVGVDAAGSDEADDVQPSVRARLQVACREERRSCREVAVGDRGVDPRQVLEDRVGRPRG